MMTAVDKDLARATKELEKRRADAAKAKEDEEIAKATYDESGSDSDLDAASKARLKRERCERLIVSAEVALAKAQVAKAAQDRAEMSELLIAERAELDRFPDVIEPLIAAVVDLDRELDRLVTAAAISSAEAGALHARAREHAHALNERTDNFPHVDLATVRLAIRRRLQEARATEAREDLSASFMSSADPSWKLRGATAAEVASLETASARARRGDEDARIRNEALEVGATMATQQNKQKVGLK